VKSHLSQRAFAESENHFSIASFLVILVSTFFSVGFTVFSTGFTWGDGFADGRTILDLLVISGVFIASFLASSALIRFFACSVDSFFACCRAIASSCSFIASLDQAGSSHFTLTNDLPPLLSPAPETPRLTFF
jgi:hypothetical protein